MGNDPKNVKKLVTDHTKPKKPPKAERIKAAKTMRTRKPTKKGPPENVLALIVKHLRGQ
jgi:hypothetical protein